MRPRLKQVTLAAVVVFAAAQLVRPDHSNPPTDSSRTIQSQVGTSSDLVTVLDGACGDCHSNATKWPWFSEVAPLSWLMAYSVREGRKAVNFSEWASYSPEWQRALLSASCHDVSEGTMPGVYDLLKPEARLSPRGVETICAAARKADADGAHGR